MKSPKFQPPSTRETSRLKLQDGQKVRCGRFGRFKFGASLDVGVCASALSQRPRPKLLDCLDVTLPEDLSRVRSPKVARVLGMIRRVFVSLANAAVDRARKAKPKTQCNTKSFRQCCFSVRGGRERLDVCFIVKKLEVLDLQI